MKNTFLYNTQTEDVDELAIRLTTSSGRTNHNAIGSGLKLHNTQLQLLHLTFRPIGSSGSYYVGEEHQHRRNMESFI